MRLVLKPRKEGMTKEEAFQYYQTCDYKEIFDVKETTIELPDHATIFRSYECECCGESTAENWIKLVNGKKLCPDCAKPYDRFRV
mgnify:CR=1 FL=1